MWEKDKQELNSEINSQTNSAIPFFARYLEGQLEDLSDAEIEAIAGGGNAVTLAYPSDQEDGGDGVVVTQRYPSDQEDVGDGNVTTKKYPSDQEDSGLSSFIPGLSWFF